MTASRSSQSTWDKTVADQRRTAESQAATRREQNWGSSR